MATPTFAEGDEIEWFDGDVATIEAVADDGRVFLRDSDGLHKTSVSTLRTALANDTERYPLATHRKPQGFAGELLAF